MSSTAVRTNCLDTSAILKLYVEEDGSEIIRSYVRSEPTWYTTPFCYYETLTMLKVMWRYKKIITEAEYHEYAFALTVRFSHISGSVNDLDLKSPAIFKTVQEIAARNSLDMSDAFQILSVKEGYFSRMSGESRTILATADESLADAARNEGIKAWYFMTEAVP